MHGWDMFLGKVPIRVMAIPTAHIPACLHRNNNKITKNWKMAGEKKSAKRKKRQNSKITTNITAIHHQHRLQPTNWPSTIIRLMWSGIYVGLHWPAGRAGEAVSNLFLPDKLNRFNISEWSGLFFVVVFFSRLVPLHVTWVCLCICGCITVHEWHLDVNRIKTRS